MATVTLRVFVILMAVALVNGINPLDKLNQLKVKGAAAIGQVKHAINAYKLNTQAKLYNMQAYLNYLKHLIYAKAFPYSAGKLFPYSAGKPLLNQVYPGSAYKLPGNYYGQPYSYVQYHSGPGLYRADILH